MHPIVVQVDVEPDGDGALRVQWELDGEPCDINIAVGTSPLALDHAHALTAAAHTNTARLIGLGPGRHYVSVSPHGSGASVVAAERRLPFEAVRNFRDLGGFRTAGGSRVRWGRIFRADSLHKFSDADRRAFEALGVASVYDLRGDAERVQHPNPFDAVHVPLASRPPELADQVPDRSVLERAREGEQLLREVYVGTLEHSARLCGTLLRDLGDTRKLPAVFHCHGGKDRTGIVAALLLLALGVDRDDALDDYAATRRYRTIVDQQDTLENLLASGMAPEAAAGVLGAPRWAMAEALDVLDSTYGGIEAYLTGPAGMSAADLSRLREQLLE